MCVILLRKRHTIYQMMKKIMKKILRQTLAEREDASSEDSINGINKFLILLLLKLILL
jgi:hypothetical protein